jgi:TetR/AcrR family transcriptional regulator, cholesterol catabolism regulator
MSTRCDLAGVEPCRRASNISLVPSKKASAANGSRGTAKPTAVDRGQSKLDPSGESPDRREQILRTAQKLFAINGFRETNLNDVAVQLGFRRQAVYHYFASKDEILYELIDRAGQAIATSAKPTLEADIPPEQALAELVRNHVRQLLTNIDIFRIQFSELFKLTSDRADMLRRDMIAYTRRIADVIAAGQATGRFIDIPPMTQALLILGMCNETIEWYGHARTSRNIEQIAEYAARMALSGVLGAPPAER